MEKKTLIYIVDSDEDDDGVQQSRDTVNLRMESKEHVIENFGSGGNSLFPVGGGGQSLLNFRQNSQISDIPPPFALKKTVFSPLLGPNFRKFVNFP